MDVDVEFVFPVACFLAFFALAEVLGTMLIVLVLAVDAACDGTAELLFPADAAARRRFVPAMICCQFWEYWYG